jgi:hypothetical protein
MGGRALVVDEPGESRCEETLDFGLPEWFSLGGGSSDGCSDAAARAFSNYRAMKQRSEPSQYRPSRKEKKMNHTRL